MLRCALGAASALSLHRALALVCGGGGAAGDVKRARVLARLRRVIVDNMVMNGVVFLCSIIVVEFILGPWLAAQCARAAELYGVSAAAQAFVRYFGAFVYYCLWLLPLYLICLIMNGAHIAEIAEKSFILLRSDVTTNSARLLLRLPIVPHRLPDLRTQRRCQSENF